MIWRQRLPNPLPDCRPPQSHKDHALVQDANASVDNRFFISKYAVELFTKEELEKFLHAKHQEMMVDA